MAIMIEYNGREFENKITSLDYKMKYDQSIRVEITIKGIISELDETLFEIVQETPAGRRSGKSLTITCVNGDEIVRQYILKEVWAIDYKEAYKDGEQTFELVVGCTRYAGPEYAGDVLVVSDAC